jgi:hypothetical protein
VEVYELRLETVPHSNQELVASPFGFTVPLSRAPLLVMEVAAAVVAVGDCARVLTLTIFPFDSPAELLADTRK